MSTIGDFRKTFFDQSKVEKAVDRAVARRLSRFGAFVRQRAKSSIRTRKKTSEPGKPPTNRTGLLKKFIYFGYDRQKETVIVGPAAFRSNPTAPELLEYGGNTVIVRPKSIPQRARYSPRPYMRPAFAEELPKFMDSLKDSVRG